MTPASPRGGDRIPNRLALERSPYLLQHQWNPVDWYPWGSEAFERARREDKPVFLSVGYSSCHWCHVMERESFESETIARLLNDGFVSIKVDREERPDVDEIYMTAVQLLTGSGGWPMSVFLTPDQKPFWGGTYFPPEDRGGRPGFATILAELAAVYRDRRPEVLDAAERLSVAVRQMGTGRRFTAAGPLTPELIDRALEELLHAYDARHGGFGAAPKFPPHGALRLLLHALGGATPARREELTRIARGTLDAMARGGIRDHVGGGFHRYATDAVWLVPHFEKMLYDNAQLLRIYAEAHALWGEPEYRSVAEEIAAWTLREMAGPEGGFCSALDADSEGGEGAYYLWSREEVLELLGPDEGALFARIYGIEEGGNFTDPVTGEEPGNIPHRKRAWGELAAGEGLQEGVLRDRMDRARASLLLRRLDRRPPGLDDKVITGWNGLMVGALATAGRILERPEYAEAAVRVAGFLLQALRRDGRLLRSFRAGRADLNGYLEDHAFLASGLLDVAEATGDRSWTEEARSLADAMLARFWDADEGGFFFVAGDHEPLISRTKDVFDQAVPSGNGIAAHLLVRLARATGEPAYAARAEEALRAFAGALHHAPRASESLLLAYAMWRGAGRRSEPGATTRAGAATAADAATPTGVDAPRLYARAQRGPLIAIVGAPQREILRGGSLNLELRLEIEPGWHIQSAKPGRSDRVATSVALGLAEGLKPGPMRFPEGSPLSVAGERLSIYAGSVTIRFSVRADPDAPLGRAPVALRVRHQACDDRRCLAPDHVEAAVELTVVEKPG